jgi:hypothetical protein
MAATIEIHEMTGTQSGYQRDGKTVRFYSSQTATASQAVTNPLVIPSAVGSDFSYTKQLRFYMGATGPSGFVASLKFYSDGTMWNNEASFVLVEYDKANRTTWGANVDTAIAGTNIKGATSGAKASLCISASQFTSTSTYFGGMLRLQMEVGQEASPGTLGDKTITFQYDEQ